jgi:hypothetical protein
VDVWSVGCVATFFFFFFWFPVLHAFFRSGSEDIPLP